jgi:hypothetical protein
VINTPNRISVWLSAFELDNTLESFSHELFVNLNRPRPDSQFHISFVSTLIACDFGIAISTERFSIINAQG